MPELPNILILSDLHLSRGYYVPGESDRQGGRFSGLEDFFADEEFFNLVAHHLSQGGRWRLILNGDVVDLLQVVDFPTDPQTLEELRRVIRDGDNWEAWQARHRKYGLGTSAIETCWKLTQIAAGHPVFFLALAHVLATGNEVIIVSGNHDVEWYWTSVQERLRELVRRAYDPVQIEWRLARLRPGTGQHRAGPRRTEAMLGREALERLQFYPRCYYIKHFLYVEHGSQYDVASSFPDMFDPVLPSDRALPPDQWRIELPIGSFFVRYFFNQVEHESSFADNVKPFARYLRWVICHRPLWAIEVLLTQGEIVRMIWQRLRRVHVNRISMQHPLRAQAASRPADRSYHIPDMADPDRFVKGLHDLEERVFKSHPPLLYMKPKDWIGAVCAYRRDFLSRAAEAICELLYDQGEGARYLVFGHNHDACVGLLGNGSHAGPDDNVGHHHTGHGHAWYYNTGTWVPIEEGKERFFRKAPELTYLKIVPGAKEEAQLLHWNDGAGRGDLVPLMVESEKRSLGYKGWGWALLAGGLTLLAIAFQAYRKAISKTRRPIP